MDLKRPDLINLMAALTAPTRAIVQAEYSAALVDIRNDYTSAVRKNDINQMQMLGREIVALDNAIQCCDQATKEFTSINESKA